MKIALLIVVGLVGMFLLVRYIQRKKQSHLSEEKMLGQKEKEEQEKQWGIGLWTIGAVAPFVIIAVLGIFTSRWILGLSALLIAIIRCKGSAKSQYRINNKGQAGVFDAVVGVRSAIAASKTQPRRAVTIMMRLQKTPSLHVRAIADVFLSTMRDSPIQYWGKSLQRALYACALIAQSDEDIGDDFRNKAIGIVFIQSTGFAMMCGMIIFLNQYITPQAEGLLIAVLIGAASISYMFEEVTHI